MSLYAYARLYLISLRRLASHSPLLLSSSVHPHHCSSDWPISLMVLARYAEVWVIEVVQSELSPPSDASTTNFPFASFIQSMCSGSRPL
ncbi:hypothetical protein C8Q74DRAFT_565861 [Fomes fomentarius]|nr:hypothetical protein C8Q74DRAFT_565861 [Fomes fomentarius]